MPTIERSKSMKKRICLFGGYDLKNEIDDYVIYLIKQLNKISDVYYFGDFDCDEKELEKLKPYCKKAFAKRHKKYDFGSWQELVKIIGKEEIRKYDELILTNDSCFGPLFPLEEVFSQMENKSCDFWGLSSSRGYHIHIQSYFVVIKKNVLKSDVLFDFLEKVEPEKSLREVCDKYEDRLTYVLCKAGFNFQTYIPYGDFKNQPYYNTTAAIKDAHFPLLKVKTFYGQVGHDLIKDWKKLISENTDYDISLIQNNLYKRGLTDKDIINYMYGYKKERKIVRIKGLIVKVIKFFTYPIRRFLHRFVDYKISLVVNNYNYQFNEINNELYSVKNELYRICNNLNIKSPYLINCAKENNIEIIAEKKKTKLHFEYNKDTFIIKNFGNIVNAVGPDNKDILFIGDFDLLNCNILNFNNNNLILLNNDIISEKTNLSCCCYEVSALEKFLIQKNNKDLKFDYIFIQPFAGDTENAVIVDFFNNLKKMMIAETTIFFNISNENYDKYKDVFSKLDLVFDMDAYGLYLDKITNAGEFKTVFLKLDIEK